MTSSRFTECSVCGKIYKIYIPEHAPKTRDFLASRYMLVDTHGAATSRRLCNLGYDYSRKSTAALIIDVPVLVPILVHCSVKRLVRIIHQGG